MINMFIEKIWIFVWIWFFVFLIVSVVNLFVWLYRTLAMSSKVRLVTDALRVGCYASAYLLLPALYTILTSLT